MDVEEQRLFPIPNNVKRFGLKNSIQTNFGDDYVFQIIPKYVPFTFFLSFSIILKLDQKLKKLTFLFVPIIWEFEFLGFFVNGRDDWSSMAVSLSTNAVKLYSPVVGQYYGECKGHTATINQILFSGHSNPNILSSCSSDGTIRTWDTRTFQQVHFICY